MKKKYYHVCASCGKTVPSVNKDAECVQCVMENAYHGYAYLLRNKGIKPMSLKAYRKELSKMKLVS